MKITPEDDIMFLNGLINLHAPVAQELAVFKCPINLGINKPTQDVFEIISQFQAEELSFVFEYLTVKEAKELAKFKGKKLSLKHLTNKTSDETLIALSEYQGELEIQENLKKRTEALKTQQD